MESMMAPEARSATAEALEEISERAERGEAISGSDAQVVLDSHDLIAVAVIADGVRRRLHGARTTFLRVFEIHVDAVPAMPPGGLAAGEVRLLGRPASAAAALDAVRAAAALGVAAPLSGFDLSDIRALAGPADGAFRALCDGLREAGLDAVSDVSLDDVMADLDGVAAGVETARDSGLSVVRLTLRQLARPHRIAVVESACALQSRVGGFRTLAPLPRIVAPAEPSTGYDDVKQVVIARLMATSIESIQVDWSIYGPKLAQVALTVGADDIDGVAAVDAGGLGARRSPIEDIKRNIQAAALEPVERNGRFEERA
jgi:hypothetical protein